MKVFVINLARSTERRASMEQQLSRLNLDYEIVEAVDGSLLSYTDIMRVTRPLNYALSCGEVGCALSHIGIYRKIVAKNIPFALILEDDARIDSKTVDTLNEIERINILTPMVTLLTEGANYSLTPQHSFNALSSSLHDVIEGACSHGYVVNLQAAKKMAEFLYPVWMVADKWQILKEYSVCSVSVVIPPVVFKTHHASLITIQQRNQSDKWIEKKKKYMWKEIKKSRPLKVKLKRLLWSSFIYPFLKISK